MHTATATVPLYIRIPLNLRARLDAALAVRKANWIENPDEQNMGKMIEHALDKAFPEEAAPKADKAEKHKRAVRGGQLHLPLRTSKKRAAAKKRRPATKRGRK